MRVPRIATTSHDPLVWRSRVVSYVLVAVGVVVLSFAPSVVGGHVGERLHVLLHVVRPIVAVALFAAAVLVQVAVGVRWRCRLLRDAADDGRQDRRTGRGQDAATDGREDRGALPPPPA
ncbi:hypothetical protein [Curtobacterium sp. MCBD17_040]|uniref:hypothetical protein n=1 Tax=Curtobacterium sp. MCBD17_040 TaxID=2175674 RepID=UPI0015E8A6F6|nr:hypothetical protein [Curtobacterium sp. MCBD17_040]WIB64385.1 hypothetical protein DEI94_04095 [Curtobacterium sp. MCBD17_040]